MLLTGPSYKALLDVPVVLVDGVRQPHWPLPGEDDAPDPAVSGQTGTGCCPGQVKVVPCEEALT